MEEYLRTPQCPREYDAKAHVCKRCQARESCREDYLADCAAIGNKELEEEEMDEQRDTFIQALKSPPFASLNDFADEGPMNQFAWIFKQFLTILKRHGIPVADHILVFDLFRMYYNNFPDLWKVYRAIEDQKK